MLTSLDTGKANSGVPDVEVLAFAAAGRPDALDSQIAAIFSGSIKTELRTTLGLSFAPPTGFRQTAAANRAAIAIESDTTK